MMFTTRALVEARVPGLILAILTIAGAFWCWPAAVLPGILLIAVLGFFRDPTRSIPEDPASIVAPADGKIVDISPRREDLFLAAESTRISIFLSVFDVHVQRSPVAGRIDLVRRDAGGFLDARDPRSGESNVSRTIGIETPDGFRVVVRQITGMIARRIVGWEETGAVLAKGQRLGMIRFGSRVELYVPAGTEVTVRPGQTVRGGETVIARRR
jgi:phosphatidylserine decarboxylase